MDSFFLVTTEITTVTEQVSGQFDGFSDSSQHLCPSQQHNSEKGRPKFLIPRSQLVGLSSLNFTWKAISKMLGVSEKTVLRRRYEFSLPIGENTYTNVTGEELDAKIVSVLSSRQTLAKELLFGFLLPERSRLKERESSCINFSSRSSKEVRHTLLQR